MASIFIFSCESEHINRFNKVELYPNGIAETVNLVYTDSGRVKAILTSPILNDYTQMKFKFNEFPNGLNLTIYDINNNPTKVRANYAITYPEVDLVDMRGNIVIDTYDGKKFESDQLYYDQKNDWFYTNTKYKISTDADNFSQGIGIDFDSKLNQLKGKNMYAESINTNIDK